MTATITNGMTGNFERSAVWGDVKGDGYPYFMRNTSINGVELRIQDPISGRFGDGLGGTVPFTFTTNANSATNTRILNGFNTEGLGFFDYDLDVMVDNHNYGFGNSNWWM